ncbi:MAG: acyl carrier protein [Bdellovibrionaceae bacterium]|nr:acyl carrier protein [Pseudobdellovibrionaceae bacterium]
MVRDDLLRILAESLTVIVDRPVASLTIDMSLADDFGLESIEILDFFVEVEQRLGRPIDLIELLRSRTSTSNYSKDICIRDIVEFIESKEKP